MRKYLLPKEGNFYKANLHSHSKLSDGGFTREEMKEEYKKRGYSIVAFSDHDTLRCTYELTDKEFLALTSYEISIRSDDIEIPHAYRKVMDFNLISKTPYNDTVVGFHPSRVDWLVKRGAMTQEFADSIKYEAPMDLHLYTANINKIIREAHENGYLVTMNHPMWSLANYNDYANIEGLWAVEVYNHGCAALSGMSDSEGVFDDILRTGKNIFCVAADDNHNNTEVPLIDSFGGFTMIKSPSLEYGEIISAMENGCFYASCGPEIYELYYEDGKVHIECSEADEICMTTLGRRGARVKDLSGKTITSADFAIDKELFGYVRFKVIDKNGKKAYTNAYYVDEFCDGALANRIVF